jgi:hypothetical protein
MYCSCVGEALLCVFTSQRSFNNWLLYHGWSRLRVLQFVLPLAARTWQAACRVGPVMAEGCTKGGTELQHPWLGHKILEM